jgi:drug/metabolite transporter (DMT)-like permease
MALSMAGFTINDSLVKLVSGNASLGQIMLVRGIFASMLVALLAWRAGALRGWRANLHPLLSIRVAGELGGTIFFLIALFHLPISTVSAILQALPLAVTMGAALVLGQAVGWRRWTAIATGFVGVLMIVRPGAEGVDLFVLSALVCVGFCTVRDLATSRLPDHVPSLLVSLATALAVTLFGAVMIPFNEWRPMSGADTLTLGVAAATLVVGYQFIILATRSGDISAVAPFRYTALLWAMALGYAMFGDVPDTLTISGAALIVGSGIYALHRDRVRSRGALARATSNSGVAPDGV